MTKTDDKQSEKLIKIYLIVYIEKYELIATKQQINKYLSNLKRCKKITDNMREIISNKYSYLFIEEFKYETKHQLNDRINELRILQSNRNKPIEKILNNSLYEKGLKYENEVFSLLQQICSQSNIIKSNNRYSKYDFYDILTKTIFELKVNTYSITKHSTAVINFEKLNYPFLTLIFGYTETYYDFISKGFKDRTNYYFIHYCEEQFNRFSKRYITNHITGRSSLIIDIPIEELKPIEELTLKNNNVIDFHNYLDMYNL